MLCLIFPGQDSDQSTPAAFYHDAAATALNVAIKMLPQDRTVEDRERQDFWEEVKFLRHLQCIGGHDNIIKFVGYVAGEEMMLLLEFAPGGSLIGYLRKRDRVDPLPDLEAVTYAAQIASGMQYIAGNMMVHRDLAARNVLLSKARARCLCPPIFPA